MFKNFVSDINHDLVVYVPLDSVEMVLVIFILDGIMLRSLYMFALINGLHSITMGDAEFCQLDETTPFTGLKLADYLIIQDRFRVFSLHIRLGNYSAIEI